MKRSNCYFNAALCAAAALFLTAGIAQASLHDPGGGSAAPDAGLFDPPIYLADTAPAVLIDADEVAEAAAFFAGLGIEVQDADNGFILLAHAGQLSPKDGCHNHKAASERHWHRDGTSERGGPCVKVSTGHTIKILNNAHCLNERAAFAEAEETQWGMSTAWRDVARALISCIQDLPALEPD